MSAKHRTFLACVIILSLGLSGCVVVPRVAEKQPYLEKCDLMTKKMKLSAADLGPVKCNSYECLLGLIGVPATTFVVSGSIVLVGNTIHWLEYQGRCENSEFSQQIESFKKSFEAL